MKFLLLIAFSLIFGSFSFAQPKSLVNWLSLDEAQKLHAQNPKILLIDMYTDWCGWCKVLDTTTFADPAIAHYINTNFYPVKFNAEGKDTILYKEKIYTNSSAGRRPTHDLAKELLNGRLSYPSIVYVDDIGNTYPVAGYLKAEQIEPILAYFVEKANRTAPYDDFKESFELIFREKAIPPDPIKWSEFPDALKKNESSPKKILVSVYSSLGYSSALMNKHVLTDPILAAFINENYYPVKFEAERTDTIQVNNQVFINEQVFPNYPHQLAIALLNGEVKYPSLVFINEQGQVVNKISGYLKKQDIEPLLHFFAKDIYQTQSWEEFRPGFKGNFE